MIRGFMGVVLSVVLNMSFTMTVNANGTDMIYNVALDGSGDFSSIQEAVDTVPDGATLRLSDGIYEESISIVGKTVNIIGTNTDNCIIKYCSDKYFEPPLEIAGGLVENVTIYGYTDRCEGWQGKGKLPVNDEYLQQFDTDHLKEIARYRGYTVHIEQNYLADKELKFKDCRIISDNSHCIGVGLRRGCNLVFEDCTFESYAYGSGSVFAHDWVINEDFGSCDLVFNNCDFYNYSCKFVMLFQSFAPENTVNTHFINNRFHTVALSDANKYSESDYKGYTISDMNEFDVSDTLIDKGFKSNDLVFCYNPSQTSEYMSKITNSGNPLEGSIFLPEGITVLWSDTSSNNSDSFFPIAVYNEDDGKVGGKWVNTSCFQLSSDSIGNTFAQMNYK